MTGNHDYFQFIYLKLNDLRGDGFVFYIFDGDKYYRVNQNFEVISTTSEDNDIFQKYCL